jgi:hypothetical protein
VVVNVPTVTTVTPADPLALRPPLAAFALSKVNMEGLKALTLDGGMRDVGSEGVAFLGRATGLTHLKLEEWSKDVRERPVELGQALSRMSNLQALFLRATWSSTASCFEGIRLLTSLTNLEWEGEYVTNADVEACVGLRRLCMLSIWPNTPAPYDCTTMETVFAVAKLPELRQFYLGGGVQSHPFIAANDERHGTWRGLKLTDDGKALINGERHTRGWPPLQLGLVSIETDP